MSQPAEKLSDDQQLLQDLGDFWDDPLGYVYYCWKWGEDELSGFDGPDKIQRAYLIELGKQVKDRGFNPRKPEAVDAIQMATTSGHGIGKSTLTAWVVCWILDTRPMSQGIITANTGAQLRTKTFAQVAKWRKSSIGARFWEVSEALMYVRSKQHPETWRVDGLTWKKELAEAFAGLHAITATPFYIFDEASAIDDKIWEVAEGGLTDGEPQWHVFGNPTRNKGRFYDCFHRHRHRWSSRQVDSRDSAFTNKRKIAAWIEDWGEDSDFVRIRVKGVFPRVGAMQFIGNDIVRAAQLRDIPEIAFDEPVIMGIDVARDPQGDESVIFLRRGRDARSREMMNMRGISTTQLAARAGSICDVMRRTAQPVAAIFVDVTGLGSGTVDRLMDLGYPVTGVNFGGVADYPDRWHRKGDEMWGRMREWLDDGGALPEKDETLADQLTHREYGHTDKMATKLQTKDDMRDEGGESPDRADALSLTFAFFVESISPDQLMLDNLVAVEYDPLADF